MNVMCSACGMRFIRPTEERFTQCPGCGLLGEIGGSRANRDGDGPDIVLDAMRRLEATSRPWYRHDGYIAQSSGTCCLVYAIANAHIHMGGSVSDEAIEHGCDLLSCRNGNAIGGQAWVEYLGVPLHKTEGSGWVFKHGGVLHIWHPIFNGHSLFVAPESDGSLLVVNSWLGPPVARGVAESELAEFVVGNCGRFWVYDVEMIREAQIG